jgi:hypothetical protein
MAGGRLHEIDCRFRASGSLEAALWVIEYAGARRVRDHRRNLGPGPNPLFFVSDDSTTDFRVLFRLRGRGRASLGDLRLSAGEPSLHQ